MTESHENEKEIDTVTSPESGSSGSVILFVTLLFNARVALGFLMNVTGPELPFEQIFRKNMDEN